MQHEGVGIPAQLGDHEWHTLGHQAGHEGDVAGQPIQLGYYDTAFPGLRRRQGSRQLRASFQRVSPFAAFEFDEFS